ncbi:MAG TPA: alkaline phosphatase family protein [Verrucomicrobiota bacterium]|nr:alkaline phosphatase family protein [Verrucomicrobiota bacterium]HNT15340.1 alkaline phosphatase family protein [Verrucomicrobiota bacterium]
MGRPCWLLGVVLAGLVALESPGTAASALRTKNVFLITTDGLRWQEVFTGAQPGLMTKQTGGVANEAGLKKQFGQATAEARRQALMPFFWTEIARRGQLYGNQTKGSVAHITNGRKFSYPGYSEFLVGMADDRIDSNNKMPNPNTNVFEWLNLRPGFQGRVAAIVNWDVIPWILNTERSRLPVWSGFALQPGAPDLIRLSPELEELCRDTTRLWDGMLFDSFFYQAAREYVLQARPRAFYVSFSETDEWAHEGHYDRYLDAAHKVDRYIQGLWETVQSVPAYKDQTTFIITTDHGRGSGLQDWRSHGQQVQGAEHIWIAVLGPDTPPLGERTNCAPVTQNQVAATIAAALGEDFHAAFPKTGAPLAEALAGARQ